MWIVKLLGIHHAGLALHRFVINIRQSQALAQPPPPQQQQQRHHQLQQRHHQQQRQLLMTGETVTEMVVVKEMVTEMVKVMVVTEMVVMVVTEMVMETEMVVATVKEMVEMVVVKEMVKKIVVLYYIVYKRTVLERGGVFFQHFFTLYPELNLLVFHFVGCAFHVNFERMMLTLCKLLQYKNLINVSIHVF